jgi:hypothetical protein
MFGHPFCDAALAPDSPGSVCFPEQSGFQPCLGCRPTGSPLWQNLDRAGPGHRRGRDHPRADAILRIIARAEIVEENDSLTHDCDTCGHYRGCQVITLVVFLNLHLPVSPIHCFPDNQCAVWLLPGLTRKQPSRHQPPGWSHASSPPTLDGSRPLKPKFSTFRRSSFVSGRA